MFVYRKATIDDLEKIWNMDIKNNPGEDCWIKWKDQYIDYNKKGEASTFVVLDDEEREKSVIENVGLSAFNSLSESIANKKASKQNGFFLIISNVTQ